MPITPRQEPTHKCPACGGRMIVFVDMEEERKLNKFSNEKVTYFRCEQCAHFQIVEK
jgi:predicted RNA-binding Zn-ribbon protein involved in translation (DUF1610 family)